MLSGMLLRAPVQSNNRGSTPTRRQSSETILKKPLRSPTKLHNRRKGSVGHCDGTKTIQTSYSIFKSIHQHRQQNFQFNTCPINSRSQRWKNFLGEYDYVLNNVPTTGNQAADFLSRNFKTTEPYIVPNQPLNLPGKNLLTHAVPTIFSTNYIQTMQETSKGTIYPISNIKNTLSRTANSSHKLTRKGYNSHYIRRGIHQGCTHRIRSSRDYQNVHQS